jgi:chromosome partitioning protein
MRIISLLTQKGGTGKSTLTCNLAVAATQAGEKVLALDLDDEQATLSEWAQLRADDRAPIAVAQLPAGETRQLGGVLGSARARYTVVLLDLPGRDSPLTHNAMSIADLCLVPLRPTRPDGLAIRKTVEALMIGKKRFAFILNQCPPAHNARAAEMAAGLVSLGFLADPMICMRAAFQDAYAVGQGVTEYEPDGKAAGEVRRLWKWIDQESKKTTAIVGTVERPKEART